MTGRTDKSSRLIAGNVEHVFDAYLSRKAQEEWLPPEGMTLSFSRFEPRLDGQYRMTLRYKGDGPGKTTQNSDVVHGKFIEITRPHRVIQSAIFDSEDSAFDGVMIMTWTFQSEGEGTRVTVVATDVPPGIGAEDHQVGLDSSLKNLAHYVEGSH